MDPPRYWHFVYVLKKIFVNWCYIQSSWNIVADDTEVLSPIPEIGAPSTIKKGRKIVSFSYHILINFNSICQFKTQLTELSQHLKLPQLCLRFVHCADINPPLRLVWFCASLLLVWLHISWALRCAEMMAQSGWIAWAWKTWIKQICHLQYEREMHSFLHGCSEGMWCVTGCRKKEEGEIETSRRVCRGLS